MSLSQESSSQGGNNNDNNNKKPKGRRRRSAPPPPRLSWPGGLMSSQPAAGGNARPHSQPARPSSNKKRPRAAAAAAAISNDNDNKEEESLLWIDQYAPTSRQELCVAQKKVSEVAAWMENEWLQLKLLILVGRPGIGKSTMVRLLAEELNVDILEWSSDSYTSSANNDWSSADLVESLSPLKSFTKFLQQSGVGFSSLSLVTASSLPNRNNSAAQTSTSIHKPQRRRLILLEELPNLPNLEMQEQFRDLLTSHIQNSQVPTVWIYSEGTEGNSKPQDLERHVEARVLYQNAKILQINPATKPQLKKCLERIAKAEGFTLQKQMCEQWHTQSGGDVRYAIMSLQFDQAGATTTRRQQRNNKSKGKAFLAKRQKSTTEETKNNNAFGSRDTQWTAFHALGKILYAKRTPLDEIDEPPKHGERPPLTFDPEYVLEHCDFDLGHTLTYLNFHSADFFTDIEELSSCMDLYSDASYLLDQSTNYNYRRKNNTNATTTTVSCPIFPEGYVSSLAGRAVAHTNLHPAPSRFRQLNAPTVLEVARKARDNAEELRRLQLRLSFLTVSSSTSSSRSDLNHLTTFVTDRLPFLRTIVPEAVNASLDHLHTIHSDSTSNHFSWHQEQEADVAARFLEEQREVLEMDDIDEFSSSDENEEETRHSASKQSNPLTTTTTTTTAAADNHSARKAVVLQRNPYVSSKNGAKPTNAATSSNAPALANPHPPTRTVPSKPVKLVANPYKRNNNKKANVGPMSQIKPNQQRPQTSEGMSVAKHNLTQSQRSTQSSQQPPEAANISKINNATSNMPSEAIVKTSANNPATKKIVLMDV